MNIKFKFITKSSLILFIVLGGITVCLADEQPKMDNKTEVPPETRAKVAQAYGKLPLTFIENKGQMDSKVRFYVSGSAGTIFFTNQEIVMEFVKRENPKDKQDKPGIKSSLDTSTTTVTEHRLVLRRKFLNPNPSCQLIGIEQLPGKVNILRGNDPAKWKQDISTYKEIKYQNLYPGIDLVYRGNNNQLEYTIRVSPNAKIQSFEMMMEGANQLNIKENGDLAIETLLGTFLEKKPATYQEIQGKKTTIPSKFVLRKKNTVIYDIGKYDRSLPLFIE